MTEQRSVIKRGAAAMETLKKEQEAAAARREANDSRGLMRFRIQKNKGTGRNAATTYQEHELVILDEDVTNAVFAHSHTVPGPGGDFSKVQYITCVDEFTNCALCRAAEAGNDERFKPATYDMYVTVIDTTPYTIKSGQRAGEVQPFTRMLYVIPQGAVASFLKVAEACKRLHGTTRGMVIVVTKQKQTDARCGIMIPLDNGSLFDMISEDGLEEEFWNDEVRRDGKVIKAEGADLEPTDYESELKVMDQKLVRRLFNLPAPPGSEDEEQSSTGSDRASRRRSRAGTGGEGQTRASAQAQAEEDAPPPRTRRAARAASQSAAQGTQQEQTPPPADTTGDAGTRRRRRGAAADLDDEIPF